VYTKAWAEFPLAAEAPGQDLALWIDLDKYQAIDPEICLAARKVILAARKVIEHHLWYLSNEAVGLALFSGRLPSAEKLRIVDGESGVRNVRAMQLS
jgi:hypothetical protein